MIRSRFFASGAYFSIDFSSLLNPPESRCTGVENELKKHGKFGPSCIAVNAHRRNDTQGFTGSSPIRPTGVVNITTIYLVKVRFESGNESPVIQPSFVSRHIGTGDPIEEWERRSDDCERRSEPTQNC